MKRCAPAGFTVIFDRHRRSWGWRDDFPTPASPFAKERYGYASYAEANAAAIEERENRRLAKEGKRLFDRKSQCWRDVVRGTSATA